jgi:hypothetical protein
VSPRPRLTNRTQATPTLIIKGSNFPDWHAQGKVIN